MMLRQYAEPRNRKIADHRVSALSMRCDCVQTSFGSGLPLVTGEGRDNDPVLMLSANFQSGRRQSGMPDS